jgi:SAM-dependent methyltransferase
MQSFWDSRARENALFFIDNQLDYGEPDTERFFENGELALDSLLGAVGATVEPGDEIVEIGCGAGRITRPLARRGKSVRALDISERMIDLAREMNRDLTEVEWIHGDGVSLTGVDSASADVCLSYVVFQHIPDPNVTLGYVREIGRVLRPGGWAAFQVSNDPRIHSSRGGLEAMKVRVFALAGRGPKGQRHPAWLGSAVDLASLAEVASEAGMRVERVAGEGTQFCLVLLRRG